MAKSSSEWRAGYQRATDNIINILKAAPEGTSAAEVAQVLEGLNQIVKAAEAQGL